jgi:hypothetical protein
MREGRYMNCTNCRSFQNIRGNWRNSRKSFLGRVNPWLDYVFKMNQEDLRALCAEPSWQWGTFEGAELHTLLLGLQTSFREKLEWLEEAETLTLQLRASRERAKAMGGKPDLNEQ